MACDGIVFDTTSGRDFYGPGGPYAALNGRDASRALAMMKINVSEEEEALGVEGLSEDEVKTLREWRGKVGGKYPALGRYERGGETTHAKERVRVVFVTMIECLITRTTTGVK